MLEDLRPGDPRQLGTYRLSMRLGNGGMGTVFLGRSQGGRLVAVKVISQELADDPGFRARFSREVAAARKVSGLFTAPVVDADIDALQPWLATAYVRGPSLSEVVTAAAPMPAAAVFDLAAGLAEGLAGVHAAGVVHRDLKPSNVLLAEDGPRIIDFGISRAADSSALTRTGMIAGSPGFMSPEQAEGQPTGPASDIFSLGAVLAFAATGECPFGAGSAPALLYRVVHGAPDLERVPASLYPLIAACLAKNPADRPGTADILASVSRDRTAETSSERLLPTYPSHPMTELAMVRRPGSAEDPATLTTGLPPPVQATSDPVNRAKPSAAPAPPLPGEITVARQAGTSPAGARRTRRNVLSLAGAAALAMTAITVLLIPRGDHPRLAYSLVAALAGPATVSTGSVTFSPDGTTLAVGYSNGTTYLWNPGTRARTAILTDPASRGVDSMAFSPDGKTLATGDGNDNAYLWNPRTGTRTATLTGPEGLYVTSVAFAADGTMVAVSDMPDVQGATRDGSTYLWNLSTMGRTAVLTDPGSHGPAWPSGGPGVMSAAFSPDGTALATEYNDSSKTYLWNLGTRTRTAVLTNPAKSLLASVAFSPVW